MPACANKVDRRQGRLELPNITAVVVSGSHLSYNDTDNDMENRPRAKMWLWSHLSYNDTDNDTDISEIGSPSDFSSWGLSDNMREPIRERLRMTWKF